MSVDTPRRINIATDRKRWWPKTIYHTYWSRISYLIHKNNTCFFLVCLVVLSLGAYLFVIPSHTPNYKKTEMALKLFKEKLANDVSPHQEKLISSNPPADTFLDWSIVYNMTSSNPYRVKAAFVVVTQEKDMHRLRKTMVDLERHFNERNKYPWIILSDKLFSQEFRHWISHTSQSPVFYGQIPSVEWQEPYWVDIKQAEKNMKDMVKAHDINSGESMSWRRMTRYNMGFVAHHPLLKDLEYYWKVQPGSQYHCDVETDPFTRMKQNGYKLSFELTLTENHENLVDFHETVNRFILENKSILQPVGESIYKGFLNDASRNAAIDINDPLGEYAGEYSNCMMYNNFAIYSLKYLRSPEYVKFFDYLDQSGGFFYHKWGDAMPQSLAAGLLLKRSEITFGDVPGYVYDAGSSCPTNLENYTQLKCTCKHNDYKVRNMRFCSPPIMKAVLGAE